MGNKALGAIELIPRRKFYDYTAKYSSKAKTKHIMPAQLTKKKSAILIDGDLIMFKSPTIYSNPVVILKEGRLVRISKCKDAWCKVISSEFKGWIKNENLWGLF